MRIGILGAGHIGANLARQFVSAGHQVKLANSREPDTIKETAAKAGAEPVVAADLAKHVELVVISIPQGAIEKLPKGLFDGASDDVIVVDTGNYYPGLRDQRIDEIEAGVPESLWVSRRLQRPVVKAFNSINFMSLAEKGRPGGDPARIALPVAGDVTAAKGVVIDLLDQIGFEGLDAGGLEDSWRQQPGTPAYCTDLDRERLRQALAKADRERAPELRDRFIDEMKKAFGKGGAVDLVALSRSVYGAP
jgi:predicted dinucleotide-binding enzyme